MLSRARELFLSPPAVLKRGLKRMPAVTRLDSVVSYACQRLISYQSTVHPKEFVSSSTARSVVPVGSARRRIPSSTYGALISVPPPSTPDRDDGCAGTGGPCPVYIPPPPPRDAIPRRTAAPHRASEPCHDPQASRFTMSSGHPPSPLRSDPPPPSPFPSAVPSTYMQARGPIPQPRRAACASGRLQNAPCPGTTLDNDKGNRPAKRSNACSAATPEPLQPAQETRPRLVHGDSHGPTAPGKCCEPLKPESNLVDAPRARRSAGHARPRALIRGKTNGGLSWLLRSPRTVSLAFVPSPPGDSGRRNAGCEEPSRRRAAAQPCRSVFPGAMPRCSASQRHRGGSRPVVLYGERGSARRSAFHIIARRPACRYFVVKFEFSPTELRSHLPHLLRRLPVYLPLRLHLRDDPSPLSTISIDCCAPGEIVGHAALFDDFRLGLHDKHVILVIDEYDRVPTRNQEQAVRAHQEHVGRAFPLRCADRLPPEDVADLTRASIPSLRARSSPFACP